jgi:hypothetical protein
VETTCEDARVCGRMKRMAMVTLISELEKGGSQESSLKFVPNKED